MPDETSPILGSSGSVFSPNTKHGHAPRSGDSKVYLAWCNMKARCYNPKSISYPNYGGRGITVCSKWLHDFEAFLADVGEPPESGMSLGRIKNDGNYEPGNVRWETKLEQDANRRQSRFYTVRGVTKCLKQLAEHFGLHHNTVEGRLAHGWSVDDAFTVQVGVCKRGRRPNRTSGPRLNLPDSQAGE